MQSRVPCRPIYGPDLELRFSLIGISWVGKGSEPLFVPKFLGKVHLVWHDMKDTYRVYSGPDDIYRVVVSDRRIYLDYILRPSKAEESATMY